MKKETIFTLSALSITLLAAIFPFNLEDTVIMTSSGCRCVGCGRNFHGLSSLRRHASHAARPACAQAAMQFLVGDSRIPWVPDHRASAQNLRDQFDQAAEVFDHDRISL